MLNTDAQNYNVKEKYSYGAKSAKLIVDGVEYDVFVTGYNEKKQMRCETDYRPNTDLSVSMSRKIVSDIYQKWKVESLRTE